MIHPGARGTCTLRGLPGPYRWFPWVPYGIALPLGIRKSKTDKIDARHIATLLKNGEQRPALVPGELAMSCRQLTRLRYAQVRQVAKLKQRLWARLHPVWPEYEGLFATSFNKTGRKLLLTAPTPAEVLALDPEQLTELVRKTSRGKFGPAKVEQIRQAATHSVGMAMRSLQQEGELQEYWLRKRREGTHHLTAVTAIAAKICRRAWRILTDGRDYLPQPPCTQS